MKITLNNPVDAVIVSEQKKTITELTIQQMIDNPNQKVIAVGTLELGRIVLWKDEEYDAIGQWTDADVENKLKAMYP
jgi:hypothetical protein